MKYCMLSDRWTGQGLAEFMLHLQLAKMETMGAITVKQQQHVYGYIISW